MEKLTKDLFDDKLVKVSDALEVDVKFVVSAEDEGKADPQFDPNAIISKLLALFVFAGLTVPSNMAPAYNRVHADIEFWKRKFEEIESNKKAETQDGVCKSE